MGNCGRRSSVVGRRFFERCFAMALSFVIALNVSLPVYAAPAAGPRIVAIVVEGNRAVTTAAIQGRLTSKVGGTYTAESVAADIRALFSRGEFADVRVERETAGGGVKLIYHMVERPTISAIKFVGNKKIKTKEIEEKIPLRAFRPLNGEELAKTISEIQALYEAKRYYLVDVDYTLTPGDNGSVLTFRINEHGKAAIGRIQFVGNRAMSDRALKKVLHTKEKGAFFFRKGKYQKEMIEQDVMLLTRHYLNHGYLRVHIARPRVEISKDKQHMFVTYTIDEGQSYRIGKIRVEGDILTTPQELRKMIQAKEGETYVHEGVEKDTNQLLLFYGTMGYAFANIQPIPTPNDADCTAELVFSIDKGRRVRIDQINITGNSTTRDKVIRREMKVKEGDLFNRQLLEDSRTKLMQLGFFSSVEFATPRGHRPDSVDLNIEVKERPTGTFNIGAGFSTYENFFFTGSVAKENFFGRGISGQVSAEVSKLRQQYVISFTDPYFLDTNWVLSVSSHRTLFRYPQFDRRAYGGSFSLGHRIFEHLLVSVGYNYENVVASNFLFAVPALFRTNSNGVTSGVNLQVSYDTRDNRIFPKEGVYATVSNEFSGDKMGGNNNFYRMNAQARLYQPIGHFGLIGKIYTKLGYIKSLSSRSIPLFERYLMGGPNSLRGYNIWSVGPSLRLPTGASGPDTNFVYGGTKMVQANFELEFPLYGPGGFKLVSFLDAGNAFAEEENISLKNLRYDYGFGLRWLSPLGPLRFEWGFPISKRPGEAGVVFNFTGGDFF